RSFSSAAMTASSTSFTTSMYGSAVEPFWQLSSRQPRSGLRRKTTSLHVLPPAAARSRRKSSTSAKYAAAPSTERQYSHSQRSPVLNRFFQLGKVDKGFLLSLLPP